MHKLATNDNYLSDLILTALDQTNVCFTYCDIYNDYAVLYVNEAFEQVTGYTLSEVQGKNLRLLQGPETDQETVDQIRLALKQSKPISVQILNYRKNGDKFLNHLEITPLKDGYGTVVAYCSFQFDCTHHHKNKEEELKYHKEKAKLLEDITLSVSRQASNLLGDVYQASEVLRQEMKGQAHDIHGLNEAMTCTRRAREMIDYLHDLVVREKKYSIH